LILEIKDLSISFGGVAAVVDFSMYQEENKITGIIGPNGAGKTTVFNLITGIYQADSGKIYYKGRDITKLPAHERTSLGISRTFQNIRLFNNMSVIDNVKVPYVVKIRYTIFEEMLKLPRVLREEKSIDDKAREMLGYFGLAGYSNYKPKNLPYGIQRRLELARALMAEPELLLLDEPAAGLNPGEVEELMKLILKIQREKKLSIIIVEHHMELIMNICSMIHVLDFGKKIAEGTPYEVKKNRKVLQAYLGDEG